MARRSEPQRYFVGDRGFPVVGAAISYAQNLASHWQGEARSFYVRDVLDVALYRVDYDEDRVVRTWTL